MTKIACYLPNLVGGGAEKVGLTIATTLAERGYEVDLVLARKRGAYLPQVPDSLRVVELGKSSRIAGWLTAARGLNATVAGTGNAEAGFIPNQPHPRIRIHIARNNFGRSIGRAVVDHDQLKVRKTLSQYAGD